MNKIYLDSLRSNNNINKNIDDPIEGVQDKETDFPATSHKGEVEQTESSKSLALSSSDSVNPFSSAPASGVNLGSPAFERPLPFLKGYDVSNEEFRNFMQDAKHKKLREGKDLAEIRDLILSLRDAS